MSAARTLRIGTRASALALWQARRVSELIGAQPGAPPVELVHIRTEGDMRTDVPLWAVDGRAFFTKEIDRALLANEIDIAVHSLKDVSTLMEQGIALAAVLEREDPRDAADQRTGAQRASRELPPRARVGTSSLRRRAFLARAAAGRRAARVARQRADAHREAAEGRVRRDHSRDRGPEASRVWMRISRRVCRRGNFRPPCRRARSVCARAVTMPKRRDGCARWIMRPTRLAATAERALLRRIEGGCQVPLGALATVEAQALHLYCRRVRARWHEARQRARHSATSTPEAASALGLKIAENLLAQGAGEHHRVPARARAAPWRRHDTP